MIVYFNVYILFIPLHFFYRKVNEIEIYLHIFLETVISYWSIVIIIVFIIWWMTHIYINLCFETRTIGSPSSTKFSALGRVPDFIGIRAEPSRPDRWSGLVQVGDNSLRVGFPLVFGLTWARIFSFGQGRTEIWIEKVVPKTRR